MRQKKKGGKGGKGQTARLSPQQQQTLLAWACNDGFSTAMEACQFVHEQFGVSYTQAGMYGLLSRLKIKKKVPRPMNVKAAEETQQAYKKRLDGGAVGFGQFIKYTSTSVVFADEMRLGLHSQLRRCWFPCGVKLRQRQRMQFVWKWLYLRVEAGTGKLRWLWLPNMKKASMAEALEV